MGDDVMDSSDILASENWDYLIFNNLFMIFNKTNVKFIHAQNLIKQLYGLPNGFGILANDLGFMTRASHNCYIINDDFGYHGIKFDLQNTNNIVGYEIDEELERYNISQKRATTRVIIENLC